MRLIKVFGLAVLSTAIAMAFVGASPASATFSTQLCKSNASLVCNDPVTTLHLVNTGVLTFLTDLFDILCLSILLRATPGALGSPQAIATNELSYTGCGISIDHDECTFTVEETPDFHLLKLANNDGTLLGLNGLTRVKCTVFGFIKINCLYDTTGILFRVKGPTESGTTNGDLDANNTPVEFVEGSGLCPEETTLDGLLLPLEPTYIKS